MGEADVGEAGADEQDPLVRGLSLVLLVLVAYRLAYHASYLGEVPFAHGTFADGAAYEAAARDILAHPPLGTEAFYLQGAYAYLLALGMAIRPWPSLGIFVQLLLAFATLALFHRAAIRLWGQRAGMLASVVLLAHPGLAFYENKHLSAELGIAANILVIAAFVACVRAPTQPRRVLACLGLGAASGLAVLARPNMVLALPCTLAAVGVLIWREPGPRGLKTRAATWGVGAVLLGAMLATAPMAARNLVVTGYPDIQPVHGGGTSFFIGNNPEARGVWNDAGLLSARLGTESREFAQILGIDPALPERERARAIGDRLYAHAFQWIADNPGEWLKLEAHKLWLTVGDQQLTQDYDWLGERELLPWAHRVGLRFSMILALGLLGAGAVWRRRRAPEVDAPEGEGEGEGETPASGEPGPVPRRALAWFLLGQIGAPLAANLLYFTSAQHRLPLVVPLALLAGPGVLALGASLRSWIPALDRRLGPGTPGDPPPARVAVLILAVLALAQGPLRAGRSHRTGPHPVHYYNLAMVQDSIGEPLEALAALDRAIELRPDQPIFHMRRAHLRVRLADLDGAEDDLEIVERIAAHASVPDWVLDQVELDRATIAVERRYGPRTGSK